MSRYIDSALRSVVAQRADSLCEYCLIHEDDTFYGCQIDHIISVKHGGPTTPDNLSYACAFCNRAKGTDLGSVSSTGVELIRFFNPRTDTWSEHFALNGAVIESLTEIGEVTARILGFNSHDRILEREALLASHLYPSAAAETRIRETR